MTPEDWARVRKSFETLCDLSVEEQREGLSKADLTTALRGHLESLLDGDRAERMQEDALQQAPQLTSQFTRDDLLGSTLGAYRIDALIGVGGMGRVYRAKREDGRFQGEVAIKFVSDGAHTQSFLRERRVLGRLQHPHIARLLDAGEDVSGRPYLVMEFVDGQQIDKHCDDANLTDLARIKLVISAARAIAHAHELLVLHRDLKPANLMVTPQGELKILDFGIAKLLDADQIDAAQTTARYFTLRYAAPEQIIGDTVSTGTDIYALALVLYELISGLHPFLPHDAAPSELTERVLANEPIPLRTALRRGKREHQLRGDRLRDLETVLQRSLARDEQAGYGSASAFSDDLQRIVDDRPVSVRAIRPIETARRWLRRHRAAAAALALAVFSISLGLGAALWQAGIARSERDAALHEAARAERIADFLTDMFQAPRPSENHGEPLQASELLDRGRERLTLELADEPLMRAQLQATIAETYRSLGLYDQAESLLGEALEVALQTPESAALEARLNGQLGRLHNYQGRWEDADQRLLKTIELARSSNQIEVLAMALRMRTITLLNQIRSDDARTSISEALVLYRQTPKQYQKEIGVSESMLATIALQQGELDQALAAYQRLVAGIRHDRGDDADNLSVTLNNLAAVQMRLNRPQEAATNYAEAARIAQVNYGEDHRDQALPLLGLGMALRVQGLNQQALVELARAREIYLQWDGETNPSTAYAQLLSAEMLWLDGQSAAAVRVLGEADRYLLEQYGQTHVYSCRSALLRIALAHDIGINGGAPKLGGLVDCLNGEQSPPNVRLLSEWAAVRAATAEDAAGLTANLAERSAGLTPGDLALTRAIDAWLKHNAP